MNKHILIFALFLVLGSCGSAGRAVSGSGGADDEYVNIGYGKVKRSHSTGSVSKVDVEQGSAYSNIYDYIKGRVPGVTVNGTSIRIRGERSILGSNEPLMLVDGMEVSDISFLSPNHVESVEVLKDASTTSIYGARGANGVIIITTRKSVDK